MLYMIIDGYFEDDAYVDVLILSLQYDEWPSLGEFWDLHNVIMQKAVQNR